MLNNELREQAERIRKSMIRWRAMNEPAKLLGRGLAFRELAGRVALEVGATVRQVLAAVKV